MPYKTIIPNVHTLGATRVMQHAYFICCFLFSVVIFKLWWWNLEVDFALILTAHTERLRFFMEGVLQGLHRHSNYLRSLIARIPT